ncbi:MAG: S8 family peptidase [Saprospiraceae bacterium]|nr:S8 family peptidase [Saprospiraceae bacterium]
MKKHIFYNAMSILGLFFMPKIMAQEALYFNSGKIETVQDFDITKIARPGDTEVYKDKFYRIVQFNKLPMPNDKAELTQKGVDFLDYMPINAFFMAFPKGFDFSILTKYDVKTVTILRGADKLSNNLRDGIFPDFAQKMVGKYDLIVKPFANVPLQQAATDLLKMGFETVALPDAFYQTVTIRAKKADIDRLMAVPFVQFVDFIDSPPIREDEKSNQLHRGNALNSDGTVGLKYDGRGFGLSYADDGPVGPNIEFQGRLIQVQNYSSGGGDIDHADATAGAGAASGNLDPALKSGASGATVVSHIIDSYPQIQNAVNNQSTYNAYVTSTSYGQGTPGQAGCNVYNTFANQIDAQSFANPKLFHVFSAGNSGGGTCINVTNYGSITGGFKLGKNLVTVGNLDLNDRLASSSSRGPSVDGRIKPDVCAVGTSVYTTAPNNSTTIISGTSFSCPATAAVATQLYHAYSDLNSGQIPDAALIKAAMLNTADDLGNPGPDFFYGWGRLNAWRAYVTLRDKKFIKGTIARTDTLKTIPLSIPAGVKQVKVMLYWSDPAGTVNASRSLVNDLDLSVKNTETGQISLPWTLNTAFNVDSLSQKATKGFDRVNNMEQVIVDSTSLPALGTANLDIIIKPFSLPSDNLTFYLVYEFNKHEVTITYPNGGEALAVGSSEVIRWEATNIKDSYFGVDFSNDGGVTWSPIASTVPQDVRALRWTVPEEATGKACVRVRHIADNSIASDLSDNLFSISRLTNKLTVKYICPDSAYLSFDTVPRAKAYQIVRLGAKYMDSIMTATTNLVAVPVKWSDSAWFSVRPVLPDGGLGRRVVAVNKPKTLTVCPTIKDLQALRIGQGIGGTIYACRDGLDRPLSIWVKNYSVADIDSFRLGYQIGSSAAVQSVIQQKIKSGDSVLYTLPQRVTFPASGTHTFRVWTKLEGDTYTSNDTLSTLVNVRDKFAAPLQEAFDNKPFPPDGFQIASSRGPITWSQATNVLGSDGQRTTTAIFEGDLHPTRGVRDTLLTWLCDLKGVTNAQFSFDLSYQLRVITRSPSLAVVVSTNCGRNFTPTNYLKTRFELTNSTTTGAIWLPSRTSHWRRDTVSLAAYKDSVVMVGLIFYPDNDNRLYIDNINISSSIPTATENTPLSIPMLTAYPNPSKEGIFTLAMKNFDTKTLDIKIFDASGRQVFIKQLGHIIGDKQEVLNLSDQSAGIYMMQVQTESRTYQLKLTKM